LDGFQRVKLLPVVLVAAGFFWLNLGAGLNIYRQNADTGNGVLCVFMKGIKI